MCKSTVFTRSVALIVILASGQAFADGDRLIIQVRTTAQAGLHFDSVRSELFQADGRFVGLAEHTADLERNYETGVRVGEFFLEALTEFHARVSIRLGDTVVSERPVRFTPHRHGHPHDWYSGYPRVHVVAVLLVPPDLEPLAFIDHAPKEVVLETDADDNSTVSACDLLRYTVSFPASHALGRRSVFRDTPDANVTLLTGSVTSSHGVVFRGNFPADSDVEVRFGPVAVDQSVSVSYLARVNPDIVNQGQLTLQLAGTALEYDLLTDDPATEEVDDPTVVSVDCGPPGDPPPNPAPGLAKVFPEIIPQNVTANITIESAGLGLSEGPPVLMLNGVAVTTEIIPPGDGQKEAVSATLTSAQTANAGLVPFTLIPVNQNLKEVTGALAIRPAAETANDAVTEFDKALGERIGRSVNVALELLQTAQA